MARPIDFPPPFGARDAVAAPTDPRDERIEVGVAIVGAGPGGLACAIRLGQLLEEHPDVRERLGDVPIAVLEKGKQAGSHLLSGAVMAPKPLLMICWIPGPPHCSRLWNRPWPTCGPRSKSGGRS